MPQRVPFSPSQPQRSVLAEQVLFELQNDVSEIDLKTSISQVECCLKAIKSLRPGAWFLENPRAKLRELCAPLLEKYFPRHILYTVSCMFC